MTARIKKPRHPQPMKITARQHALLGEIRLAGSCFLYGADVRVAQALTALGYVKLEDNGTFGFRRSDGERWWVTFVREPTCRVCTEPLDRFGNCASHLSGSKRSDQFGNLVWHDARVVMCETCDGPTDKGKCAPTNPMQAPCRPRAGAVR